MNPSNLIRKHSIALENYLCSLSDKTTYSLYSEEGVERDRKEMGIILNRPTSHPLTSEPRTCDANLLASTGVASEITRTGIKNFSFDSELCKILSL